MTNIDNTLKERGGTYGNFLDQSTIAGRIKDIMIDTPNWVDLDYDMKEALDMIAVKIARLLNGDPSHLDSWHDIIGYTRLVEARLEEEKEKENDGENPTPSDYVWSQFDSIAAEQDQYFKANRWDPINPAFGNTLEFRGISDVSQDILPANLSGWWFLGYDGQYEYWERPNGTVGRYDTASHKLVQNPTISGLFPSGGGTFNPLYDLTQGDGSGTLSVATGNGDGGSSWPNEPTELRVHDDRRTGAPLYVGDGCPNAGVRCGGKPST